MSRKLQCDYSYNEIDDLEPKLSADNELYNILKSELLSTKEDEKQKMYRKYYKYIDNLIKLNKKRRKLLTDTTFLERSHFLREFSTVNLNIGRQIGSSFYILNKASFGNSIVVVKNTKYKVYFKSLGDIVYTLHGINEDHQLNGKDLSYIETIYVDCFDYIFENNTEKNRFYDMLAYLNFPPDVTIVGLG